MVPSSLVGPYDAVAAALDAVEIEVVTDDISNGLISSAFEKADPLAASSGAVQAIVRREWDGLMSIDGYPS